MLANALAAQERELSPARRKDVRSAADFARQQLAEQQKNGPAAAPTASRPQPGAQLGQGGGVSGKAGGVATSGKTAVAPELRSPILTAPSNPPVGAANGKTSLKLAKTIYAPQEEVVLDFTASSQVPADAWVGLIPANTLHGSAARNDQHDKTFQNVKGRTGGRMVFRAPGKVGKYDLRMSTKDKDQELLSITFTVAVPDHSAALILPKKIFAPKEAIQLDFEASPLLLKTTWVGLIPDNIPHGSTARNDQHDITFQRVDGRATGQMAFTAPARIGRYGFRMNETTNDKELAAVAFEVAVPAAGNTLKLAKAVFAPKEAIQLDFEASPLLPKTTWVGLIPDNIPHGSTARNDQHDITFQRVDGRATGQMVFTAPAKIGAYGFRMNETTNDREVAAVAFKVAVPVKGNVLTLSKIAFAPNAEIKVTFKASALLPKNTWVGLIPANIPHGSTARNDQHDITFQRVGGRSSGQMVFRAPARAGKYDFRMNETTNDKEVATVSFTVAEGKK